MKKISLLFLLTTLFLNIFGQQSQKIHIIQILDFNTAYKESVTDAGDAGYMMAHASESIQNIVVPLFSDMANKLNLQVENYLVADTKGSINYDDPSQNDIANLKYTPKFLEKVLVDLKCENDIVVVLYSGHGFSFNRTANVTYPNLMLNYNNNFTPFVNYGEVLKTIHSKKPKMVLSLISACQTQPDIAENLIKTENQQYFVNNTILFEGGSTAGIGSDNLNIVTTSIAQIEQERAKDLFLLPTYNDLSNNQLSVELISSSHGEQTYINNRGGHFIRAFRDIMTDILKCRSKSNWQDIAFLVEKKTKEYVDDANKNVPENEQHKQNPQCFVYAKSTNSSIMKVYDKPTNVINCSNSVSSNTGAPLSLSLNIDVPDYYAPYSAKPSLEYAKRLVKLGNTYREAGKPDFAINAIDRALPVLSKSKEYYVTATAYENLAYAYLQQSEISKARENFIIAMKKFDALNACGSATTIKQRLLVSPFNINSSELSIKCIYKK